MSTPSITIYPASTYSRQFRQRRKVDFPEPKGEEAMNYFTDNPDIKLALCDYRIPVKDGLEVLKEIRAIGDKNQIGVLMMTSPSENVNGAIFLKNGANDFIAKPFVKEELICRVNNTIEAMENINQIADFANKDFLTWPGGSPRLCTNYTGNLLWI